MQYPLAKPSPGTAQAEWRLLRTPDIKLKDLLGRRIKRLTPELETMAMQAFTVSLDTAITAAEHGQTITAAGLLAALGARWSDPYLTALQTTPAKQPKHLLKATAKATWKSLLAAGLNFNALYRVALNGYGLFTTELRGQRAQRIYVVRVNYESRAWREFTRIIQSDDDYKRTREWSRLLFAHEDAPRHLLRGEEDAEAMTYGAYDVAAEWAFNKALPGPRSINLISALEATVLTLKVDEFRKMADQTERTFAELEGRATGPQPDRFWKAYAKADGRVNAFKGIRAKLSDVRGDVRIKSSYYKVLNRRLQARHFGPGEVQAEWRLRLFADRRGIPLAGADINSSQLQILAVFLGLTELEESLRCERFKVTAARRAWERHEDKSDPFTLPPGYSDGADPRLQELCKYAPMTALYGSPLREIASRLEYNRDEFGPGLDQAMLKLFLEDDRLRLDGILQWFLPACRSLPWRARQSDVYKGIVFSDPFDGEVVRWNHIRTRPERGAGDSRIKIYVDVPVAQKLVYDENGKPRHQFPPLKPNPNGDYEGNPYKQSQVVAPCLVHTMDALFNGLVIEELIARGIKDIVPIHDCWLVPADRESDLHDAIAAAGKPWLQSLGPIYDLLEEHLGPDKKFGPWVREIRAKWECRVGQGNWPAFQWTAEKNGYLEKGGVK